MNLIYGYRAETNRRKAMKSIFGQYVPPGRIDTMMDEGGSFGLEGEVKELTVLFSDIRNFTAISEKLTARDLKVELNTYLTPMTQAIFNHKGTIDKYVGDMVMAFWGAPLDDPKHAFNGVAAGLEMQKILEEDLNPKWKKENMPEIHIGVGINTGLMNVGDMGSKFRRAYTVLGDAVNLSSRLEKICRFYNVKIIVGENTYKQTASDFSYRQLDRVQVKGKEQANDIYEPLCYAAECAKELQSRLDLHNKAIKAYFAQDWKLAETSFNELLALDPTSSALYTIYLDRIGKYLTSPPAPTWNGVFSVYSE